MADTSWLTEIMDQPPDVPTGKTRVLIEYRDRDGATWYQLAEGETRSPLVIEEREIVLAEMRQTHSDGTTTFYWQRKGV